MSWRLLKAWNKHELLTRAAPVDPATALSFAGLSGSGRNFAEWHIAVAFDFSLRTGKLILLQRAGVAISGTAITFSRPFSWRALGAAFSHAFPFAVAPDSYVLRTSGLALATLQLAAWGYYKHSRLAEGLFCQAAGSLE